MTCMRRAVLHIRPLRTPKGVPFLPVSAPFLTLTSLVRLVAKRNSPSQKPYFRSDSPCLFMLSKWKYIFLCLLKRVIDPSVLNHSIWCDNNAIRITCQEVLIDFLINIKYDMLINTKKATKGAVILSYGALWKENQFLRREHTDHKKTQRNETAGTCG